MKQWLGRPSALSAAFRSAFSRFGGRALKPIFAPLLTTLRDTFSGTDAEAAIRASTATVEVYDAPNAPILKTAQINEARRVGMRRVENLIRYSEQFDNAAWSRLFSATVTPNTAVSPSGSTTADTVNLSAALNSSVFQSYTLTVGQKYTFSVWMKVAAGTSQVHVRLDNPTVTTLCNLTTQWQRFEVSATATGTVGNVYIINSVNGLEKSIIAWGAQLENVTGQTVTTAGDYVSTTTAARAAYFPTDTSGNPLNPTKDMSGATGWVRSIADWVPATYAVDEECNHLGYWYKASAAGTDTTFNSSGIWVSQGKYSKRYGLLVEESRTNAIGQSTNMTLAGWATIGATKTATTVIENTATSTRQTYYTYPAAVATGNRVISCEATNLSGTRYLVLRPLGIGSGVAFAAFDLVNGTVFATGGTEFVRAAISPTHDGRFLCEMAANHAVAPTGYTVAISNNGTELPTYLGNGTSGFNVWNHQSEAGLVASSRIEATGGAAVTRSEEQGNVKWSVN